MAVSCTTNPVTQTDVVDENNASTNDLHSPFTLEIGKHNKKAPIKIKEAKLNKIYLAGDILKNVLHFERELINLYYHSFKFKQNAFNPNTAKFMQIANIDKTCHLVIEYKKINRSLHY